MGLEVVFALVSAGASYGAALSAVYGTVGALAIRVGFSLLANAALTAATRRKPAQQDLKRDLAFPTSRPTKRFPYGADRVPATVLPYPVVGEYAYAAWLVSSRESDGFFTVFFDNREVTLEGDPFDFDGPGATPTAGSIFSGHVNVWFGLSDQTQPPQLFLNEAGYVEGGDELLWKPTDAGRGCTIVWARLKAGDNGQRSERWPNPIPQLEVEGRFSKVWDMRDPAQDPDDPSTWTWSDNAALCAVDLARQNPFRPYDVRNLELDMWSAAADVADETVPLKNGGSEPRYRVGGIIAFDGSEIEDLMEPMITAAASRLVRSGGQLGVVPGAPRDTVLSISDSLGGLSSSALRPDNELVTELRVNYSPSERGGEPGELAPWAIPGALAADKGKPSIRTLDLGMVGSATQAQRVRNITGKRVRHQRRATVVAPPYALECVAGSVVRLELPAPYTKMNGLYEVEGMSPFLDPTGENGFAMRCPMSLIEYSDDITAWDPQVDEEDVVHPPYDGTRQGVAPPGEITIETGNLVNLDTGGGIIPRVKYLFPPSTSSGIEGYEFRTQEVGGTFEPSIMVDVSSVNGSGQVFTFINGVADLTYNAEGRTIAAAGRSEWVRFSGATPVVNIDLDAPTDGSATSGMDTIDVTFRTPNDADFRAIEFFGSDTDDVSAASIIGEAVFSGQNTDVTIQETGLGPMQTRFYFARSRGDFGNTSAFTASVTATTVMP